MDSSLIIGALLGVGMIGFLIFIRFQDLPKPEPVSPFRHLDERKAAIYESLRDLQFEYRVDKISDGDYQSSKVELQKELARVMAETDRIKAEMAGDKASPAVAKPDKASAVAVSTVCPTCGAKFAKALKFCGECGKPMAASV